jgi:hypothetical protein
VLPADALACSLADFEQLYWLGKQRAKAFFEFAKSAACHDFRTGLEKVEKFWVIQVNRGS